MKVDLNLRKEPFMKLPDKLRDLLLALLSLTLEHIVSHVVSISSPKDKVLLK